MGSHSRIPASPPCYGGISLLGTAAVAAPLTLIHRLGWADKEWSSTNHKYNKHRPSSRLSKVIAKYFLVFEMSLGSNSEVLILMKLKIRISRHYLSSLCYIVSIL
jgi:hypothetical protein